MEIIKSQAQYKLSLKKVHEHVVSGLLDSLKGFCGCAGTVVVHVSHKVGCYVHLAEGGDGQSGMCNVLYVSMRRRVGDDIQELLRLVRTIRG